MNKIFLILAVIVLSQSACDLKPKIMSLPDSVGDFISERYPAMLADPNENPEIYNSAVTDYGVYASPELYGSEVTDDYVVYASIDDYIVPPQQTDVQNSYPVDVDDKVDADKDLQIIPKKEDNKESGQVAPMTDYLLVPMYGGPDLKIETTEITVEPGDTLYNLAQKYGTTVDDLVTLNALKSPYMLRVGQKLQVAGDVKKLKIMAEKDDVLNVSKPVSGVRTATKVDLMDVIVKPGDTLYSISRQYSVPVNDLAIMNGLTVPFSLAVGQKIRVPNLAVAPVAPVASVVVGNDVSKPQGESKKDAKESAIKGVDVVKVESVPPYKESQQEKISQKTKNSVQETKKISSDPSKKLPKIAARSSSSFTWPVRGKILSGYGAKSNGLFNDGINISATAGSAVKAAENGVVAYAGNEVKGMGNLVIVQHAGGWMTVYAHMDSMLVRRGAKVTVGQKIGTVGKTGKVDVPQLHFEIRKGTKAYNPISYLKK